MRNRLATLFLAVLAAVAFAPLAIPDPPPVPPSGPLAVARKTPEGVSVTFAPLSGSVTLQTSTNLRTWSPIVTVNTWPARSLEVLNYEPLDPVLFFRIATAP